MRREQLEGLFVVAILLLLVVVVGVLREPSRLQGLGRLVSFGSEAAIAPLDPPYEPVGRLEYVNLSKKANKKLSDGTTVVEGNTLESLPQGEQTFAGVKFNIADGLIQLASVDRPEWPTSVEGIPVEAKFVRLYLLHATQGGASRVKDGTLIGRYVVHYEDGKRETIPIVYGEDVRDWWNIDDSASLERGKVGWVGDNAGTRQSRMTLRLFVSEWDNPKPDAKVVGIDYLSEKAGEAAPFCIAMTAERATEPTAEALDDEE